ncbi:hypothetical protein NKDENANG_03684 [Candidatus Entotheonellaceae bacterium PAL068K]
MLRKDLPQFLELGFGDALLRAPRQLDQAVEFGDLGFEFGPIFSHCELLNQNVLDLPAFRFGEVVEVFGQCTIFRLELAELLQLCEPFAPPFK